MTVKNEENALKRALPSIAPFLSSYCIGVDNKTTDNTKGVIAEIMQKHEVPGITFDSPWHESFADARNQVLMIAARTYSGGFFPLSFGWTLTTPFRFRMKTIGNHLPKFWNQRNRCAM